MPQISPIYWLLMLLMLMIIMSLVFSFVYFGFKEFKEQVGNAKHYSFFSWW